MTPKPHQLKYSQLLWDTLVKYKYALLFGLVRSGKTLTSLLTLENSKRVQSVLIITKKSAISGWNKFIDDTELKQYLTKQYTVLNYEALGRVGQRTHSAQGKLLKKPVEEIQLKVNPDDYDVVLLDEIHMLAKVGKPSARYKVVRTVVGDKPFIALSGTPTIETGAAIYYEFSVSTNTPFPQKDFYTFFREWGIPALKRISSTREVNDYTNTKPELQTYVDYFTVRMSQADAGISEDLQSKVVTHQVDLDSYTKVQYNKLQSDKILKLPNHTLVADTSMKLSTSLYMMECGVAKVDEEYIYLGNLERINYIKQNFTITSNSVILSAFIGEQRLLKEHFPQATVDSVISKAEGVSYAHADNFIITSLSFSGSKYVQVIDRVVDLANTTTIPTNILVTKGCISQRVFDAVSNKQSFNTNTFKGN